MRPLTAEQKRRSVHLQVLGPAKGSKPQARMKTAS